MKDFKLKWIMGLPESQREFKLIDVGAHVGRFAQPCLASFPKISQAFCYEPDVVNFGKLTANLKPWADKVRLTHAALGATNDTGLFYCDLTNTGNCSLLREAMGVNKFKTRSVPVLDARIECAVWGDGPIFYKSDAQGYDELIATTIDLDFWDNVFGAIFELWRIKKPAADLEKFRVVLSQFKNIHFIRDTDRKATVDEAMTYLSGLDGKWDDLAVSK